jgi:hypothetical protein
VHRFATGSGGDASYNPFSRVRSAGTPSTDVENGRRLESVDPEKELIDKALKKASDDIGNKTAVSEGHISRSSLILR